MRIRALPAALAGMMALAALPAGVPVVAERPEGTLQMVEALGRIALELEADPGRNLFLNRERAARLRRHLADTPADYPDGPSLRLRLIEELLGAGDSLEALAEVQRLRAWHLATPQVRFDAALERRITFLEALCQLRIAEQENCVRDHSADSCLFPIQGAGVHLRPEGSRAALGLLTRLVEEDPTDLRARWLLNLASMTLGEFPSGVPPAWRIPPAAYASAYPLAPFPDVAGALGLDVNDQAGGCIAEDFDRDGDLDLLLSSWGLRGALRLYRNNADGTFTETASAAGLDGITGGLNLLQADYDNDGWTDVWILRGAWMGEAGRLPNSLLRNLGDGTFADVTHEAGLFSRHPTQAAVWLDFNGDGWLDLFVGNETSPGDPPHPCELFRNNRDGTFSECAAASGLAVQAFVKGVTSADYDGDGRPDLYVTTRGTANLLFRNEGPAKADGGLQSAWRFTEQASIAGVTEPRHSFPTWFWDYDNDGRPDLAVMGYGLNTTSDFAAELLGQPHGAAKARLYHNEGGGRFADVSESAGVHLLLHAMGCNFGDLDNDGWLDFYVGTGDPDLANLVPNRMFRNDGHGRFQDVTTAGRFGHLQKGHAIAFADLDNDGDQDVYAVMGGAYSGDIARNVLFQNPGHGHGWLTLELEGVQSNRSAIGARVRVVLATPGGERSLYRTVGTGASFGANPLRQEIGLGDATAIARVEILWPATGRTQVLTRLRPNRFYRAKEDATHASEWTVPRFPFTKSDAAVPGGHGT